MIELYSSEDLMQELMARYDDVIFCARQIKDTDENTDRVLEYRGDKDVCIGLAEQVKMDIVNSLWKGVK